MAYGRNFGMRSFENVVRDARFRVPSTGSPLRIGSPVALDTANPGKLVQVVAAAPPTQACGVVVFEHIQNKSDDLTTSYDSPYDVVPLGVYAQMMHGPGAKVWFKNTTTKTLYDGRQQTGFAFVAGTLNANWVGTGLTPAAGGTWAQGALGANTWLVIEQCNPTTGLVEARFTF